MTKAYQRQHLRSPYRENILYADAGYVFKAHAINLSEGGMLLDQLPQFPSQEEVAMILPLPQLPLFKNFSLIKMVTFSQDIFPKKLIRVKAKIIRKFTVKNPLDEIFLDRIAVQFNQGSLSDQKLVEDYVSIFASNLIYLQILLDSYNTDEESKSKVRALSKILGYTESSKLALLRSQVTMDYKNLQWS